jgi:uncharacterized alpha-E superfamily protein
MLSRVASSLFWLARYAERADNTARFLAVTDGYARELQGLSHAAAEACWAVAAERFATAPGTELDPAALTLSDLMFNLEIPNSVLSSITVARENARSIRDAIAGAVWEALNVLYLQLVEEATLSVTATRQQALLQQVQETSLLLHGLCDHTMMRSDEWHFVHLGRFLERADNTIRVADTMFSHRALQVAAETGHNIDALHLATALRICAAAEAFARTAPLPSLDKVVAFLLLEARFPRSVAFCLQELERSLHALSRTPEGLYTNEAEQLSGRLLADLRFADVEEIIGQGLRAALVRMLGSVGAIGRAIEQEYFS